MACGKNCADVAQKDKLNFSVSYCWSQEEEHSIHWKKELLNGQVLMVLTAQKACSSTSFDAGLCAEKLTTLGIQMTTEQWRNLIHCAVLQPDVRKYMFYNSRGFEITIAVLLYVLLWVNLYSTLQVYSLGRYWEVSILVTFVAAAAALLIRLLLRQFQRKINVNTDMRLAAANETFMEHEFLVGVTDVLDKYLYVSQLWFVYFNVGPCVQALADSITEKKQNQESALWHNLDEVCLVIETAVVPVHEETPENTLEESPLLLNRESNSRDTLTCQELLQLIPDGAPEVMAQQLLTIFSGYYVRLLVSSQLPEVSAGRHIALDHTPCLCQFIETTVLEKKSSWFKLR